MAGSCLPVYGRTRPLPDTRTSSSGGRVPVAQNRRTTDMTAGLVGQTKSSIDVIPAPSLSALRRRFAICFRHAQCDHEAGVRSASLWHATRLDNDSPPRTRHRSRLRSAVADDPLAPKALFSDCARQPFRQTIRPCPVDPDLVSE